MTCPQLRFVHDLSNSLSSDIWIDTSTISVGQITNISVKIHNSGPQGQGQIQLYWAQVVSGVPSGTFTALTLPAGYTNPTASVTVPGASPGGNGTYTFVVPWCPDGSVQPSSQSPNSLAIFVTAIAPVVAGVCGGVSHPNDFDWTHSWNAANIFAFS